MRRLRNIIVVLHVMSFIGLTAQSSNPAPYCTGTYGSGTCNQPGPSNSSTNFVNDFIDFFRTTGGNINITNDSSGCNSTGGPTNYIFYCQHILGCSPGQTITCSMKSGIIFSQGFSVWIDWNQDNVFQNPGEQVCATGGVPTAATWTTLSFVVPTNQPNGAYRMRVKCAYFTAGTSMAPCGNYGFGECEDYTCFVGPIPQFSGPVTATAMVTSPTIVCSGQNLSFSVAANYSTGLSYTWTGPNNFSSTAQAFTLAAVGPTATGMYSVIATNSVCPGSSTASAKVVAYPSFAINPTNTTICQNGSLTAMVAFASGVSTADYTYTWSPNPGAGVWSPHAPSTIIQPVPLPTTQSVGTVIYSLTVSPTIHACPALQTMTVTINNPLTPTLTMPPPLCDVFAQRQLTANPTGGVWSQNPGVSPSGLITPSLTFVNATKNHVRYTITIGNCAVTRSDTFLIAKYHTPALSASLNLVCEQDPAYNLMNLVHDTVTGKWSGIGVSQNKYFIPQGLPSNAYTLKYNTWSTPGYLAWVCPDSTTLAVPLFNPPTPTVMTIAPKCTNMGTVMLSATPSNGTWTGNSGVSFTGVQTPSLSNNIGTNFVTYAAGIGTCLASSTASYHVSQFNTATLTKSVDPMCESSPTVDLLGIVQNTGGIWSGPTVSNNVFYPAGLPTNNYTLTYHNPSSPMGNLCPDNSQVVLNVLNPPTPTIVPAGPFCSIEGAVQLSVSPTTGTWVSLPYFTNTGLLTPSLAPIGSIMLQYVTGTSTCSAQQTTQVNVEAFVPATLNTTKLADQCNTSGPISLLPYAANNLGTWMGPGVQGQNFNPGFSGAGQFVLNYTTASIPSGLCPDLSTVAVQVFSMAPPQITPVGPFCNTSGPVELQVSPAGGIFATENSMALTQQGLFRPFSASIGDNIVTYSISSGPCVAFAQSTIQVQKFISADFNTSQEQVFCRNQEPINLNSLVQNPGGDWTVNGVKTMMFDPQKANLGSNNFVTYHVASLPYPNLCPDASTLQIRVDDTPTMSIPSFSSCAPFTATFGIPTNLGQAEWNLGDGSPNQANLSVKHTYTAIGSYSVTLSYTLGACKTNVKSVMPVVIYQTPDADFEFKQQEVSIASPQVDVENRSTIAQHYLWSVQGSTVSTQINPTLSFMEIGTYQVNLSVTSHIGCKSEVTKYIDVKNDFNVYIPNMFTPNDDGLNDRFMPVFSPYGLDPESFEMEVYDRWGHLVVRTKDMTKGWDGTMNNKGDHILKQDVYIYIVKYRDSEGRVYSQKGAFTLMP